MLRKTLVTGLAVFGLGMGTTQAASIDLAGVAQPAFKALSEDLTSALSYKAITPAEPLGMPGFDIGLELTATEMANDDKWAAAVGGDKVGILPLPKLHAHIGLPLGIDVGAVYSSVDEIDLSYMGGELRYSFVSGNVALPAVSVRGTFSKLSGVDDLSLDTKGVELSVSKGFLMFTPYAGIGQVWATSTPGGSFAALEEEDISMNKWFVGLNINLGLTNIAIETDQTGDSTSYSAKLGFRF